MSEATVPNDTAMVKMERSGLVRPAVSTHDLIEAHKEWAKVVSEVLEPGRDFGKIPGTEGKNTLLKPGAERLALAAQLVAEFDVISEEIDHDRKVDWTKFSKKFGVRKGTSYGVYRYALKCRLIRRGTGELVGEGVGAASSMESKYIDRPRDVENVVFKMAKKRCFVDAILTTLALSDRFTQDLEDMVDHDVEPAPKARGSKLRPVEAEIVPERDPDGGVPFVPQVPWGKNKGKPIRSLLDEQLFWYLDYVGKKLQENPDDVQNRNFAEDIESEIERRRAKRADGKPAPDADELAF